MNNVCAPVRHLVSSSLLRLASSFDIQGDPPNVCFRQSPKCGHSAPSNTMLNDGGVHPRGPVRWLNYKLRWTWRERPGKWSDPATSRSMTVSTLLLVNVATPVQVPVGWREWRKLCWMASAEFDVQENRGEASLDPRWFRFTRQVNSGQCCGAEHGGQRRDDK
jgi:hypothetical protein